MIDITSNVQEAIRKIQAVPAGLTRAGTKTLKSAAETVTRIMKRQGRPSRSPVNWDTPKQKRKVMAKLKGKPYKRTGATANAWETRPIESGYQSENIGHNAVFLYGAPSGEFPGAVHVTHSGQSHIHQGRWPLVKPVVDAVLARLPQQLLEALRIEVNQ